MPMKQPTIDRETPEGRFFMSQIEQLQKLQVKIGFQRGQEQYEDEDGEEVDLCDVALFNELGTSTSPSRPFMRDAVDNHREEIDQFIENQFLLLAKGKTDAQTMMKSIGVFIKGLVQTEIVEGDFEPNAPSTIKKKGSDRPLIDTGTMRRSVNYVVTNKGGTSE